MIATLLALVGFILEGSVYPLWLDSRNYLLAGLVHGGCVFMLVLSFYVQRLTGARRDRNRPAHFYGMLLIGFFPVVGLGAAAIFYLAARLLGARFRAGIYEDYEAYFRTRDQREVTRGLTANLLHKMREEVSFEPLVDIMSGQNVQTKAKAIVKLSKDPVRENIRLLKEATRDRAPEIRLYAATALLKIETALMEKIEAALKTVRAQGRASDFSELGDLYYQYAESGMVERSLEHYYLTLSAEAYRASLDAETDQPRLVVHYGKVLLKLREFDKAKKLLDHALKIWPRDPEIIFLRNEVYFGKGLFADIGGHFESYPGQNLDERRKGVLEFWKTGA